MQHVLHSVFITFNRLHLTKVAIDSYLETVTLPHTFVVVDNHSERDTRHWLDRSFPPEQLVMLGENRFPGYACNRGWELAPPEATLLHRADNDFRFLPGWCDEATRMLDANPRLGQLGLRTDEEELFAPTNVGGNCVVRRALWEQGLRYDERPWGKYPAGHTEDSFFTPAVVGAGWEWDRVERPCIVNLATGDTADPYYRDSYRLRGIL
jgi:hypothetical protein